MTNVLKKFELWRLPIGVWLGFVISILAFQRSINRLKLYLLGLLLLGCVLAPPDEARAQAEFSSSPPQRYPLLPDTEVHNLILFIGDGMGLNHLTYSRLRTVGREGWYNVERMPVTGLVRTHCADLPSTDSAAAATAIATGFKTKLGMIGVAPDGIRVRGIIAAAQEKGMATGLISMLDGVTGAALEFALRDRHTLVVVTADHETGGLALVPVESTKTSVKPVWTTTQHTAQLVPLFAFGPNAVLFTGMKDNTELAYLWSELLQLPAFPQKLSGMAH